MPEEKKNPLDFWLQTFSAPPQQNWNNAWNQPYASNSVYRTQPETASLTATAPPTGAGATGSTAGINTAVTGLLTPGLVPDIARQSAEIAGGRGVGGSPAGASTAVRMSEQNWLQRLGLANTLLSGESSRTLPYQITPYQAAQLELQRRQVAIQDYLARKPPGLSGGGGGGFGRGGGSEYPFANVGSGTSPFDDGWGSGTLNWGRGGNAGGVLGGGGGLAGINTLEDADAWFDWDNQSQMLDVPDNQSGEIIADYWS